MSIDNDDIGGVVTSAKGPEAGVWVIAETTDLPTRFARMVVTDDQGRYLLPDLPKANYNIWVRGYGLVDSPKVKAAPGKNLNLTAVVAPNDAAAAQILSGDLLVFHDEDPGRERVRRQGRKFPQRLTQHEWLNLMKINGCVSCHQLGRARDAHLSRRRAASFGRVRNSVGGLVAPHPVGTSRRTHVRNGWSRSSAPRPSVISPTGPTASPRASCPMRSRRGRKAWSATSSSRPGIGSTRNITSTT